jgi:ElaB/YqjD/DUF883 family membrane-anchored ribosome-binding protein
MEAKKGNEEVEMLKDDIARLREDIASLASAVLGAASDTLGDTLGDAKAKVNGETQQARDEFKSKMNDGVERGKQFIDDIDTQVTRHPVGSVLVAFGVGLLIAKLLGSGNSR